MVGFNPNKIENISPKISEIEGNGLQRQMIVERDQIGEIVEPALVKACEVLYDKNIETIESSANSDDVVYRGSAGIGIHYTTL